MSDGLFCVAFRVATFVRARSVHKTCPRCGARFKWLEPLPSNHQSGPWWRRYVSPTLMCKSCGARMRAHVRPSAWVGFAAVLAVINVLGPSFGEALAWLMENWSPLAVFVMLGALLGLIGGLIGRWG